MKKLRLDWESLEVESFAATAEDEARAGTVDAREALSGPLCGSASTIYTCCPCTPRADDL